MREKRLGRKILMILLSLVLVMGMVPTISFASDPVGSSDQGDGTYTNPVIWADVPDTDVIRVGDVYWMSSTTMHMNPGVPIMKSYDLVNWETVSYCYNVLGDTDAMKLANNQNMYTNGTWASSLRYKDGTFYLVVPSPTTNKTYIFQTEDPENQPWRRYEINARYHDCGLLLDDDGRNWLVYGNNPLYIIELNATMTGVKEGAQSAVLLQNIHAPDPVTGTTPTSGLAEGAHLQKINGKYYIFCITWPSGKPRTEVVHISDSLMGPYTSRTVSQESVSGAGVAQGGIVDMPDGKWYGILFRDSGSVGRMPWLMPITWDGDWPMFGENGSYTNIPRSGAIPMKGFDMKSVVASDEFNNDAPKPLYYEEAKSSVSGASSAAPLESGIGTRSISATEVGTRAKTTVELITNGGIENGSLGWSVNDTATIAVSTEEKASGDSSLYVSGRTTTGSGPRQIMTGKLELGKTYNVSFKVKYVGDTAPATKTFNLCVRAAAAFPRDNNPIQIMRGATVTKGQWTTISGSYTMPAEGDLSTSSIFIETGWVSSPSQTTDLFPFYVDDVSITTEVEDPEILENGGFEDGTAPWGFNDTATIALSTDVKASGANSLYVSGRTTTGSGPAQEVTGKIVPGATYTVSFKVYYDAETAPATKTFNMNIKDSLSYSSSYNPIKIMRGATATKGQWTTISGDYTILTDIDTTRNWIFIETPYAASPNANTDTFPFYVDDVSMVLKSLPEPEEPEPEPGFEWDGEYAYNGSNLNLAWQWNHNPDNRYWSLTERAGWLRLTTGVKATNVLNARNSLTQRTFGPTSSAETVLDVTNMKNGDAAGLALFTARYGSIAVRMADGAKTLVMTNSSSTTSHTDVATIPLTASKVYLKADADFRNQTDKGYFYYSLDGKTWTQLGNTQQMAYATNNHFMGYRFALFNYATDTTGGYVDFDYYRVSDQLKGATTQTVLGAEMQGATGVVGEPGTEVSVPVRLDPLPDGSYTGINAAFSIPAALEVTDVVFDDGVKGKTSWKMNGDQLELSVNGSNTSFAGSERSLFATIRLRVAKLQAVASTVSVRPYYIRVTGGNVVYDVDNVSAAIAMTATASGGAWAKAPGYNNPIITHKYGADPYALVYNGRVYVYMTDDQAQFELTPNTNNSYTNCRSVSIVSSADLVNWTDHGKVPVGRQLSDGLTTWASNSWAPAAAVKKIDGKDKFFIYFADSANGVGVLEADSPIGPFHDPIGKALISRSTPNCTSSTVPWLFDPAVLVDDDGKAYLYFGGGIDGLNANNPKSARCVQLGDDMTSIVGTPKEIDAPRLFEDSGIHKYNGKYYYSYCSNFSGSNGTGYPPTGTIAYMVSDNPLGPFTYVGPILPGPGNLGNGDGGNNHHAIFQFNGKWYIIYHNRQVNIAYRLANGLTGHRDYRSPSITPITFDTFGKINPTQMERFGPNQVTTVNPYGRVEGETLGWIAGGVTTKVITGPGPVVDSLNMTLTNVNNNKWVGLGNMDFGKNGAEKFKARLAPLAGGTIEIHLDSLAGKKVGELTVPAGDGTYQLLETTIDNVKGVRNVFFLYKGEGTENLFDIDYWSFVEKSDDPATPADIFALDLTVKLHDGRYAENSTTGKAWADFTKAINDAKAILAKPEDYTKTQVDAAKKAIEDAVAAMKANQVSTLVLEVYIDIAKEYLDDEDLYIKSAVTALKAALAAAEETLATRESQAKIDKAADDILAAIEKFDEKGDLVKVSTLVSFAGTLTQGDFTEESWAAVSKALEAADKVVLKADDASWQEADFVYDQLMNAILGLKDKVVLNFYALDSAIARGDNIAANAGKYVASSITGLNAALTAAKNVRSSATTQKAIDDATVALATVIAKARLKADLSDLQSLLTQARSLNLSLYTEESAAPVRSLSAKAAKLTEDDSQQAVDSVAYELSVAISALERKPAGVVGETTPKSGSTVKSPVETKIEMDKSASGGSKAEASKSGTKSSSKSASASAATSGSKSTASAATPAASGAAAGAATAQAGSSAQTDTGTANASAGQDNAAVAGGDAAATDTKTIDKSSVPAAQAAEQAEGGLPLYVWISLLVAVAVIGALGVFFARRRHVKERTEK